ncbi:MAG: hypothetical protein AVDCRST_MAG15-2692 [uncultured Rubellimicrobium sp.]|uniref:Uncharacterized protein n=1 Tax=uncultured Rubellimicrobium sp. TaxID=543078 RepID=A0A6J4PTY9_9RHOB|nr:MAG: hypothetical protein AVDCRST_MAG15-2692 [uncultured Rubellimicrobium sp.]
MTKLTLLRGKRLSSSSLFFGHPILKHSPAKVCANIRHPELGICTCARPGYSHTKPPRKRPA